MLYPQQNPYRNRLDLSGIWSFLADADDRGRVAGWSQGLPESRPLAVPASGNEQYPDLRDHLGPGCYQYDFHIDLMEGWKGQTSTSTVY